MSTLLLIASALLFMLLTVLVLGGFTQWIDVAVFHQLRPHDGWAEAQIRLAPWMSRLRPQHMYVLLGATSLAVSLWRRSPWPLVFSMTLAAGSAVLTVVSKAVGHRVDPHGFVAQSGGAYPSGHTVTLIVCLGGCLLIIWPRVHWWLWAPVAASASLLACSLLVAGAHWLTDVVGGGLLGVALLAMSSPRRLRHRAHGR